MKIFIGCSSHIDIDNKYIEDAKYISNRLSNKYDLVVGGIQEEGIPGTIYKEFINNNRKVYLYTLELYKEDLSKYSIKYKYVANTFERTKNLYKTSDKILILPGGSGTFSEIFSMLEDNRTIESNKEIIIYNQDNYYSDILKILMNSIKHNFNDISIMDRLKVFNDKDDLLRYMEV
jgi:uncharacterized protein (TIGR00730 family)